MKRIKLGSGIKDSYQRSNKSNIIQKALLNTSFSQTFRQINERCVMFHLKYVHRVKEKGILSVRVSDFFLSYIQLKLEKLLHLRRM